MPPIRPNVCTAAILVFRLLESNMPRVLKRFSFSFVRLPKSLSALLARVLFACWFFAPLIGAPEKEPTGISSQVFEPRSGPRGPTLFTTLDPKQTNVLTENRYADPSMWRERFAEFAYGSLGTGVAIGDFDGDGKPDIFVVNKSDPCRLYRNLGGMRFEDVTEKAGLKDPNDAWKQGAAFVDVNNDGRLDLYICRFNAPNLLFINQGNGTFVEGAKEAGLDLIDSCVMASFCDYDRDGWLDVYITTNLLDQQHQLQGQRDHLFHNRGDGTFVEVTKQAGLYGEKQSHSAIWWDFNNDGWPDLYVANDFNAPDQVYRNNGDGTFTDLLSKTAPHIPYFSMGTDLGDVNNDGLIDLYVADMAPTSRQKNQRGMLNMRAYLAQDLPSPDVAPQYMQNALLLNTGTSRFQEAAQLAGLVATDWTWSVRWEDLDEDGLLDLHVTNGTVRDFFDSDLLGRKAQLPPDERQRAVIAAPLLREHNFAYRNRGDLQFEDMSTAWGLDHEGISFGAAFGDLDGDGDLDLVFVNYQGKPTICRNDSAGAHHVVFALRGIASNRFGIGAVVRLETKSGLQVRTLSSARGYLSTSEPVVHFGLGASDQITRLTVSWPSGRKQVFENLAADRRYTLTEPDSAAPSIASAWRDSASLPDAQFEEVSSSTGLNFTSKETPFDEVAAQRLLPFRHQAFGPGVAVGDVDGDGNDDVLIGGAAGEGRQLFLNAGGGQYTPGGNAALTRKENVADAALLILDVDGDGNADLLVAKGGVNAPAGTAAYQPRLLLGQGIGLFREAPAGTLPDLPLSAGPAIAADFNRDGRMDVFVGGRVVPGAYPTAPRSALLVNREGKLVDATTELAPGLAEVGMVTSALWSDVDQDGWVDLIVTLEWGGVRCWRNIQGKRLEDVSDRLGFITAGTGWWTSVAAGDFNGDGRLDYALGNVGLNTPYRASPAQPALLLYGDFDGSGRAQIMEAVEDGGRLMPRRGRNQLSAALPGPLKKIPTFEAYASASLHDLFSQERVEAAARFSATEFRSGVLLSQPDGTFRFSPLPRIAQIAPIFGVVAGDFDGDGKTDLYAVQNSFAPIPEIGRFDGGLSQLMRGDGGGNFQPVPPRQSGLVVPGDTKGLAVADLDDNGWPDFIITRNNNSGLVFRNRGVRGHHPLRVVLRSKSAWPIPIGARATLELNDRTVQVAEVYCGGGYLSQSSSALFFGFTDENNPRELRVTWPDGKTSVHPWTEAREKWMITEP